MEYYLIIGFGVLAAYFVIIWLIGAFSRSSSLKDFLISGRNVGLFQTTASIVAVLGGMAIIAQAALAFKMGFSAVWYWAGISLGMVGFGFAAKKVHPLSAKRRFHVLSDYFFEKFDRKTGLLAAVILFIALFCVLVGQFIAAGSIFSPLLGVDYSLAVLLMALGTLGYLLVGGFKAVVRTDLVQFIIMFVLFLFIAFSISDAGFLPKEFSFSSLGGANIFVFLFIGFFAVISGPEAWQRIFASKDVRTARNSCFLSAVIFFVFGISLTVIGIAARKFYPGIDPNQALFFGIFDLVPAPLLMLSVIALLASIMSTIDTEVFYLSISLSKDFFRHRRSVRRKMRFSILGITFLSALTAVFFSDILSALFGIVSLLFVITPAFLASLKWDLSGDAVFFSFAGGFGSLLLLVFTGTFSADSSIVTLPAAAVFLVIGQFFFRKRAISLRPYAHSK